MSRESRITKHRRDDPSVVIIGAGMTGIGLVIALKAAGISDITLLEKADTLGGTWRENTYPGIACDVPSHAYTYSFEPNPEWSHVFPPGGEIHQYFRRVFFKYGVDRHTRFNQDVVSCVYDGEQWQVTTAQGEHYRADLLFCATGILHHPKYPDLPGLESFAGPSMHSARWDHSVELAGKRIGVIGTGSSAAQIIPELVLRTPGTEITVFQRTAQWIVHTDNTPYSERDRERFRSKPALMQRRRRLSLRIFELGTSALSSQRWTHRTLHRLFAWNARRNLKQRVRDPELREQLTPDYQFGCKRVVMNGEFYEAIQRSNAHLVTAGIDRVEADGIVTKDGEKHPLDVLVMATGFDAGAFMRPMELIGRNGLSLQEAWRDKASAYRSLCIPGFPNFFLMLGPNSPIGNYSVIDISERQIDYALRLIRHWQAGELDRIEVAPESLARWRRQISDRARDTVWASGCQSWYLDADGEPLTWPGTWRGWVAMMRELHLEDFVPPAPASASREPG